MTSSIAKKRIYLINRDFQLRYTAVAVGVGFISTILTLIVLLFPLYSFQILRIPKFLPTPILSAMGLALIVNIGSLCFMGILVTHRIAGPMYAIVRQMRRLSAGRWTQFLKIRDEDELKYVVRNLNELTESLQFHAKRDLETIDQMLASNDINEIRNNLSNLKEQINARLGETSPEEEEI